MVSLEMRTLQYYVDQLSAKADKFALVMDTSDAEDVVRDCIRKMDQVVSYPRIYFINNPPRTFDLPDDVDEILHVKFSVEMLDPFVKEFGLLPLVSKMFPMTTLENATEFLLLKGNLNMLSRHLKFAPDWEYYPPKFIINGDYRHVVIEYLPHLDGDMELDPQWLLNSTENTYVLNRAWALLNLRNAQALMTASYIGVGTEYSAVHSHWETQVKEIDEEFTKGSVITYAG